MLIALDKPYGVLSQFTPEPGSKWRTLANFGLPKKIYPLGRLDADSEGLLLFSDETGLNNQLLDPKRSHQREYWVQLEGSPGAEAIRNLRNGVTIKGHRTRPAGVELISPAPQIPPRDPPIRYRTTIPDCWISLTISEGKNRQVRRMTASVGHPTLRLIRVAIGQLKLTDLAIVPGHWRELSLEERALVFAKPSAKGR